MSEHSSSDEMIPTASSAVKGPAKSKNSLYNPVVDLMERVTGIAVPLDSVAMYRLEKDPSSVPLATTDPHKIFCLGGRSGIGNSRKKVEKKLENVFHPVDEPFADSDNTQEQETRTVSESTESIN
uniref:Uncharacterized protein n=1 Tax=Trichuris muris TaxID=70415 RepID=A0A5S6PZT2_TRIMR